MGKGKQPDESWAEYNHRASLSNDAEDRMQYDDRYDNQFGSCGEQLVALICVIVVIITFVCLCRCYG